MGHSCILSSSQTRVSEWSFTCRLAIIIELGIQNWADAAVLLGIQLINATIGWYETMKSGRAVAALKASLKPEATVKRDGKMMTIDAALLVPGDCVLLGSGSAVPADCMVNEGRIEVDQSALTGACRDPSRGADSLLNVGIVPLRLVPPERSRTPVLRTAIM
jgi:H+-transporting ATPase